MLRRFGRLTQRAPRPTRGGGLGALAAASWGLAVAYDVDSIDNRDPKLIERLTHTLGPVLERYFSPEVRGLELIPEGAALYVGNHSGGLLSADSFILGQHLFERHGVDAVPYGLAHDLAVKLPVLQQILVPLGAVRASPDAAHRLFEAGRKVLVYPGGDRESLRPFKDRNRVEFAGRKGYMRLAVREGVPIVPIVAAGAHATFVVLDDGRWISEGLGMHRWARLDVFPISVALPWGIAIGTVPYFPFPTRILIEVLEPMRFERTGEEAASDDAYIGALDEALRARMQEKLTALSKERGSRMDKVKAGLRWLERAVDGALEPPKR